VLPSRMWKNWNSHTPLVGIRNSITTLENSLATSYQVKYTLTTWPNNPTYRYLAKRNKHVCLKTRTPMIILSSFIPSFVPSFLLSLSPSSLSLLGQVSLCSPHWLEFTILLSLSQMLGLQVWTTTSGFSGYMSNNPKPEAIQMSIS
jgi:hypothetical protein